MSQELANKLSNLKRRANALALARQFFSTRGVTEVDTALMRQGASIDAHIDLIPSILSQKETHYLISSPEHAMKGLLADGMGDIYQLGKVFRDEAKSPRHNHEFTMCEWYRVGFTFEEMIDETIDFIALFLGDRPRESITYREAFQKYLSIDYLTATPEELRRCLLDRGIEPFEDGDLLNQLLGLFIEPQLGKGVYTALTHYPADQAALARSYTKNGEMVAERFEIYYEGIELANGYHELADALEQRIRYQEANALRQKLGKSPLPIDEEFLKALEKGLPDCCGVAVGFDRVVMLHLGAKSLVVF